MIRQTFQSWGIKIVTLILAALATLTTSFWILKIVQQGTSSGSMGVSTTSPPPSSSTDPKALARVLGGGEIIAPMQAGQASVAINLILQGVITHSTHRGTALISVHNKPAKPFSVGATVDGDWVLQSLTARTATLKNASGERVLELPPFKQ